MKTSNIVKIGVILILALALELTASFCLYAADYALDITAQNGTVDTELILGQKVSEGIYQEGSKVKLIAHANAGYRFSGWEGDISGTLNFAELTIDVNKAVTANFTPASGAVVNMTQDWFSSQGQPPYLLTQGNTTYILYNDLTVDTTAFVAGAANVILDLNGYTVTYGNSQPITVTNGGFEQGTGRDVPGWDLSGAPNAAIAPNTNYLWGNQVLRLTNITATETIISDPIAIPFANHEYTATINALGGWANTVRLLVVDTVTGVTLGTATAQGLSRALGPIVSFTPTTTNPVRLRVEAAPAVGTAATIIMDYASLTISRDYGVVCYPGTSALPSHLQTPAILAVVRNAANSTIQNGIVLQGQGRGCKSCPLFVRASVGTRIENVETLSTGTDTSTIQGLYASNLAVRNCTLRNQIDRINDRMLCYGVIHLEQAGSNVIIEGNRIVDAPQMGIYVSVGSHLTIRNNIIESNAIVGNGYGISLNGNANFEVSGNRIIASLGKSSRGILMDGLPCTDGEIFGNYVDIRERPNPEFGAEMNAAAFRLRSYRAEGHRNIHVHDNTFIAHSAEGYSQGAVGIKPAFLSTTNTYGDWHNLFENNMVKAIVETTNTAYYARAVSVEDVVLPDTGLTFKNNILESNHISIGLGGTDGTNARGVGFVSNTLRKSSEGAARSYQSVLSGYPTGQVQNIKLIDNRYENGATPAITWIGSGLKDISTGWLLGATIQNSQGQPLQGATLDIFDKDNTLVFTGTSDNNGKIADIPLITTIYRQEGTNPGVITTDNRTPHHLEVSLVGYDTSTQDISLTESREITLTLGSPASTSRHITSANLNTDPNDELVIDFGTNGIWTYSTTTNTWNTLHPIGSEFIIKANLDSDPNDDLVIDFGQYGIWIYSNNTTWTNLHNISPDTIIKADLDSNTLDDLVIDFGQYGIWIYSNNNIWSQLHTLNPDTITKAKLDSDSIDELVIDFGTEGVWIYYPNSGTWTKLHNLNPESIISANIDSNPIEDLIIDFGTNGIWVYYNNNTWSQLHTLNPESITRANLDSDPKDDLVIDFGTNGIWVYYNNNAWAQLHTLNPESITRANLDSDPRDDLVIDFGTNGIWIYSNNSSWAKIHE